MPFAKGQSGNPAGRPKKGTAMADALRAALTPQAKAKVLKALVQKAQEGDIAAIKLVFERTDGAVPQPVEHTGAEGGAIVVRYSPALDTDAD